MRAIEADGLAAPAAFSEWELIGWRRPNTTAGVLDEPKTWGPVFLSTSGLLDGKGLRQAEVDVGVEASTEWP